MLFSLSGMKSSDKIMPVTAKGEVSRRKTEATLKVFKRHSRSPGVCETLNERIKLVEKTQERRRRRRKRIAGRTFPLSRNRSPFLDVAKCRTSLQNLRQVRNESIAARESLRDNRVRVLGIAMSDVVSHRHSSSEEDLELDLSQSLSKICHVNDVPVSGSAQDFKMSPNVSCRLSVERSTDAEERGITREPTPSCSFLEQIARAAQQLSRGLDPTDLLKLDPLLTTMSDHVRYLRVSLANQGNGDVSFESDSEEEGTILRNETPSAIASSTPSGTFVLGEPASLSNKETLDFGMCGQSKSRFSPTPPPWLAGDLMPYFRQDYEFEKRNGAIEENDSFSRQFGVNFLQHSPKKSSRCSARDPFIGFSLMDMDGEDHVSDLQPSTSRCGIFEDVRDSSSDYKASPLDCRSPGLGIYERLVRRTMALTKDDEPSPPNFFAVPRPLI